MKGKLLFLGTGGSAGIPMMGCDCAVCASTDPCNKRLRPSVLLTIGGKKLLIDTGPDLRAQALSFHVTHLDGVLLTHTHFDHIAGLDELRSFYVIKRQVLTILAASYTIEELKRRFFYLFQGKNAEVSLTAQLHFEALQGERGETTFLDIPLRYMTYEQGGMKVTGFRFGTFAYICDISKYDDSLFEDLQGVNTLVLSAIRMGASRVHFTVDEAVAFAKRVGATHTYLTHISHELDHEKTNAYLPHGIALAYDGLEIDLLRN